MVLSNGLDNKLEVNAFTYIAIKFGVRSKPPVPKKRARGLKIRYSTIRGRWHSF
jgi:hypothetical protein